MLDNMIIKLDGTDLGRFFETAKGVAPPERLDAVRMIGHLFDTNIPSIKEHFSKLIDQEASFDEFVASFRKSDVMGDGNIDMAIWYALNTQTKLFSIAYNECLTDPEEF